MTKTVIKLTFDEASEIAMTFSELSLMLQKHGLLSATDDKALANVEARMMNKIISIRPKFIEELIKAFDGTAITL